MSFEAFQWGSSGFQDCGIGLNESGCHRGYKLYETWPPEFSSDELTGLEIAGVSSHFVVMAVGKDGMMEGDI